MTRIGVAWRDETRDAFLALNLNTRLNPELIFPVSPGGFAYYGSGYFHRLAVDYYFEVGEAPVLEMGSGGAFNSVRPAKLTVTGYIVDVAP